MSSLFLCQQGLSEQVLYFVIFLEFWNKYQLHSGEMNINQHNSEW